MIRFAFVIVGVSLFLGSLRWARAEDSSLKSRRVHITCAAEVRDAPPDADAIYARYKNAHTPLITIQHADREVPGLRQRLEGLAKQRGVPLVYEPSPSHEHLARLERQAQRGIVPGGPTVSRHDAKAFLGALEAIASGKVRVA